jgi:hypothetical protein
VIPVAFLVLSALLASPVLPDWLLLPQEVNVKLPSRSSVEKKSDFFMKYDLVIVC